MLVFVTMSGFVQPNIVDDAHIIDKQTQQLINEKNNRYLQNKEQPQIAVITVKRLNKLTPKHLDQIKRTAFIVVGQKGKKRNVQIYSTKDLHAAFTAESRMNIIRAASKELRSQKNSEFNKGLRFVFRACATKIDMQYQYSLDKYDLSQSEQDKIDHPRRVALPIALALVVIVVALMYFFRRIRSNNPNSRQ
ncbi:TPM domain-containing protein [Lactobacillus kalixensis]|uniref:TPM domain-containing protein n=1 Tax=Lactobacillus kalixensis TaxID=227944 RepID=UPI000B254E55|nr:TPM domain-containing protein [Lactobacillus kalixensis]